MKIYLKSLFEFRINFSFLALQVALADSFQRKILSRILLENNISESPILGRLETTPSEFESGIVE